MFVGVYGLTHDNVRRRLCCAILCKWYTTFKEKHRQKRAKKAQKKVIAKDENHFIYPKKEHRERGRATLTGLVHVFLVTSQPQQFMLFY